MQTRSPLAQLAFDLRVIRACAVKEVKTALRSPAANAIIVLQPLNFLILAVLFAVSGGQAPTTVVLEEQGPHAQAFVQAMQNAHSFLLRPPNGTTAQEAQQLLQAGETVAVVTIPADFDQKLDAGKQVTIPVTLNNLNTDFSNDIRRALPMTITQFYAKQFPNQVVVQANEVDVFSHDTDYIPYLAVSILVIGLMLGGLIVSGTNAALEYESNTVKELLLSPASRWAIQVGKVLGALVMSGLGALILLLVVMLVLGVYPENWLELLVFTLVVMPIFGSFGAFIGTALRSRRAVIPLSLGLALPIFFLSGAFGPASFGSIPLLYTIARLSPAYYAIAEFQHAFHSFVTTPTNSVVNLLILVAFAAGAIVLSALMMRRSSLSH